MRLNLVDLAEEHLPQEAQAAGRTEVLPVQWRKHLNLSVSPPDSVRVSTDTLGSVRVRAGARAVAVTQACVVMLWAP